MQAFQLPKCDARLFKDDRSRAYGIRPLVTDAPRRKTLWTPQRQTSLPLDQGAEGECVGFGWAAELQVPPVEIPVHNAFARLLFKGAQAIDLAEGRDYGGEGATVLAGAKYAKKQGWISEYRWTFGMEDLRDTVILKGPVVLGIPAYSGMYQTDATGLIWLNGSLVGGHCILCIGFWPNHPLFKSDVYILLNSWGRSWGITLNGLPGVGFIKEADMRRLMIDGQGEGCIATDIAIPVRTPWWRRFLG